MSKVPVAQDRAHDASVPRQAIVALVLAIVSLVLGLIPAVAAIIVGGRAREEIRSGPSKRGVGIAQAAVWIGWITAYLSVTAGFLVIMGLLLRRMPLPTWEQVVEGFPQLIVDYGAFAAFGMTILLTIGSAIGSLLIGTIVAVMRVSPVPFMQRLGAFYVNVVRNTPLTLIVAFFALGFFAGMRISPLPESAPLTWHNIAWGIIALSVYHASFVAEALRSGVNTVPQGQAEAARAIGLDFRTSLGEVVLPQAFRGAIAPLGNTLIALTKNTTVVATIGVAEASYVMRNMIEFSPDLLLLIFALIAIGFVILTLPTGLLFTSLSRKLAVQR